MAKTIDARGLSCPHPVIMAIKAIAENEEVTVLVDNAVAVENIRRLAEKTACGFSIADKGRGTLEIALTRKGARDRGCVDPETMAGASRLLRP